MTNSTILEKGWHVTAVTRISIWLDLSSREADESSPYPQRFREVSPEHFSEHRLLVLADGLPVSITDKLENPVLRNSEFLGYRPVVLKKISLNRHLFTKG